uniref:Uncharacterized protein n=1 Tax=Chromera velia CCMP2878 TaxID=1169474 RepID=A0A0G4H7J8_9ALVE|eukprot:Cvel_24995.t1-p1 / transcript=Cvel_24995.t1 / gene=Cvel_24995 / organism=Chromera_velia_CCMP2878 / gene_product=hypothetical protein / transcript_product=hypothetical protein / location=Cvel_scaffold2770:21157-21576(+) / protein_length=140 / sequence_SO=supercontig / SO=protein_coding / is_pseudo=false
MPRRTAKEHPHPVFDPSTSPLSSPSPTSSNEPPPQYPPQNLKETLEAPTDAALDPSDIITTLRDLSLDDQRRLFFQRPVRSFSRLLLCFKAETARRVRQSVTGSASRREENERTSVEKLKETSGFRHQFELEHEERRHQR